MTENKRYGVFTELLHTGIGITVEGKEVTGDEVVDLLNEQEEIIIEQSIQLDFLKNENQHMKDVLDENKQLKERIKKLNLLDF
jgi:hypothetical protein